VLNNMSIEVDYLFPGELDAEKQAQTIAIGQTAGTWDDRFAHRQDLLTAHLGKVLNIQPHPQGNLATISFPVINVENDIPSLLTMIFGKYSMAGAAKVMAVRLPVDYGLRPKLGIQGIRERTGVADRPLIMAIFKPALGLTAQDHGDILREVATAGLDLIKDDEILGNLPQAPTMERLQVCRSIINDVKQQTGKEILYAVNLTGRADKILRHAKDLVRAGANALLLNVLTYGFGILEALAAEPGIDVPIFAHPALAGAWCGAPQHGLAYSVVLGTLMAHAGADAVLYPAHYGNLPFDPKEETKIKDILRSRQVFPVPSAGIRAEIIPQILQDYGSEVILNAGTGIMDYPGGAANGVQAFLQGVQ
jgi:2,3-diketo-5-methylthiopentyl-1-phosphate enolase